MKKNKVWIRMPESMKVNLKPIRELASKGLNKSHIGRQLSVHINSFNKYREVNDAFENGRSDLAVKVSEAFSDNIASSYSDRVHLSKSLRLYASGFNIGKIESAEEARQALSRAIQEFASGKLNIDDLEVIRKAVASYNDIIMATAIEDRLQEVEKQLRESA